MQKIIDSEILETDLDILNRARNQVAYAGAVNSLVEWTMAPSWSVPSNKPRVLPDASGEFLARF